MKACSLQICSGGKREAEPLEKHLFVFRALSQAPRKHAGLCPFSGRNIAAMRGEPDRSSWAHPSSPVELLCEKRSASAARELPNILTLISLFPLCYSHYQSGSSLDILIAGENQSILKNVTQKRLGICLNPSGFDFELLTPATVWFKVCYCHSMREQTRCSEQTNCPFTALRWKLCYCIHIKERMKFRNVELWMGNYLSLTKLKGDCFSFRTRCHLHYRKAKQNRASSWKHKEVCIKKKMEIKDWKPHMDHYKYTSSTRLQPHDCVDELSSVPEWQTLWKCFGY